MGETCKNKYFDIIQVFRGLAALMVVIHHCYGSFTYLHHINIPIVRYIASIGKYGVDFFFVLSGFIITYTSFNYGGDIKRIKEYLLSRFIRIYIPYWPVSILMLILYYNFSSFSNSSRSISWITSLFLYPDGNPALSVAWTLVYEVLFYIVFIVFFISKRGWNLFIVLWVMCILYCNIYLHFDRKWLYIFTNYYNLEFILGYLIAASLRYGFYIKYQIALFLHALCLFLFFYLTYWNIVNVPFLKNMVFAISTMFLIVLGVCYYTRRISKKNVFMAIGNATYSIYLIHNPLQAIIVRILPKSFNNKALFFGEFFLVIAMCCSIGYLYYLIFEKKLLTKIKRILLKV